MHGLVGRRGPREQEVGGVPDHHVARGLRAVPLGGVRLAFHDAAGLEHVDEAALRDAHAFGIDAAPAADLRADGDLLLPLHRRGEGRAFVHAPEDGVVGRAERAGDPHRLRPDLRIVDVMHVGRERGVGGLAGRVEIDRHVDMRQQHGIHEMRQHEREGPARVAGEAAVDVAAVGRESRVLASTAGMLTAGIRITRPSICFASRVRASFEMAIGPSYSLP